MTARFAALALLLLLAAAGAADNVLQFRHTPANHGRWSSPKLETPGVGGAALHATTRAALRGNALDLQGQAGFQHLWYREPVEPVRVEFDFKLGGPFLVFLFNGSESGFEGVRIASGSGSLYFAAEPGGRFLRRAPLKDAAVHAGWNRFAAVSSERGLEFSVDGVPLGAAPARFSAGALGFRGSREAASVDNVRAYGADGRLILEETFHHWSGLKGKWTVFAALLAAAALALAWAWRRSPRALAAAALLAAAQWGFSWVNFTRLSGVHPSERARRPAAIALEERKSALREDILSRYGAAPGPGVTRVLFLGTSQTAGLGVEPERTFVSLLESRLNGRGGGRYEFVNASVLGGRPEQTADLYETEWKSLGARLVVINLSPRRDNPDLFLDRLAGLLELNRSLGVRTLLVCEARSYPRPRWDAAVWELSERSGAPLLDLQRRLSAAGEEGFLWLDPSHLTPFGHQAAADALEGAVRDALGR
jgi:hypothetical protein